MRRLLAGAVVSLVLMTTACGGDADPVAPEGADTGAGSESTDQGDETSGLTGTDVPECPFDTDEINTLTGITLNEDPDATCLWRNESGSGLVNATMASQVAVSLTYDYSLETAGQRGDSVEELDGVALGFTASGELRAQAVLVTDLGGYTVTVNSLAGTPEENQTLIRALADHIIANH